MSIDQIASEALRLPPKDRALLAESLWESLEDPYQVSNEMGEATVVTLAVERNRQIEAGEVQPLSHDALMAKLRR